MQKEQMHKLVDILLDLHDTFVAKPGASDAARHFRAARREALLGIRAMVDGALMQMESPSHGGEAAQESTTIPVEG